MSAPAIATGEKLDIDHLRQWIGRTQEATDIVTAQLVKGLRATLFQEIGEPKNGDAAPWTTHWCLAVPVFPMSQLSQDGHPTRGGFLPPVPLPRRMWAGGELEFFDALRVGDESKRSSRISDVNLKTGSTGTLCFVSVEHLITSPRGTAIRERQDIVYREATSAPQAAAKAPPPAPAAKHRESHVSDPVLLFRYSALTFNGHRIHYDRDYVTKVEGYPGLVFHGPLQAAFIIEFAAKLHGGRPPKKFVYRGEQPLFEGSEFSVNASDNSSDGTDLWTANAEGQPTMKGTATW